MPRRCLRLAVFVSSLSAGIFSAPLAAQESAPPEVPFPKNDAGLAVLDARKKAQIETEKQFKVFYNFHFSDKLKESGITFRNRAVPYATSQYMPVHYDHGTGIAVADVDGDGKYDIYFVSQLGGNELWRNLGNDTTNEKGPEGAYVGMKDAFSGHLHSERFEYPTLYKNMGHYKFKDVTKEVGLDPRGWCGDASFADLKGDGFPGIYFLNMQGSGHYFENIGGKTFADKTTDYFPKTPWGSMGLKFFDYDNDGRMDLFITDMHSDMMQEQSPEHKKKSPRIRRTICWVAPRINLSSATLSITIWAMGNSRKFPTKWASNRCGRGESAWAT